MKFIDLFAGIGGFRLGMEMAGHRCISHCEIDKYADKSYRAMHDVKEDEWFGTDIREVRANDIPRADIWCFGFPCQDISVAGKQVGFDGHRSSLFFSVTKLIRELKEEDRPKYLIAENVKNFFSVNDGYDFLKAQIELDEIGYDAEWQLLNSKHFGVPQSRERVFIVGHLRGRSTRKVFPIGGNNGKAVKQVIDGKENFNYNSRVYSIDGIARTLMGQGGNCDNKTGLYLIKEATKVGYAEAREGDSINLSFPDSMTRRGRVGKGVAQTLDRSCNQGTLIQGRIRRLTPKECFRLQGFPDDYFERAAQVNSDSQIYKQAGNSVTVNVIYEIVKKLEVTP